MWPLPHTLCSGQSADILHLKVCFILDTRWGRCSFLAETGDRGRGLSEKVAISAPPLHLNTLSLLSFAEGSDTTAYSASDDSDWAPGGAGGGDEEEEDVAELVADAQEFMGNKKMRR